MYPELGSSSMLEAKIEDDKANSCQNGMELIMDLSRQPAPIPVDWHLSYNT
jgi:hypothetical protein